MSGLLNKQAILVTGKGGVGRTSTAAAIAVAAAEAGRHVLLTEIEEPAAQSYSPLARLFDRERLPRNPEQIAPGVTGVLLQTVEGTELFLTSVLKVRAMAKLAMRSKALLRLLHAAPSFHEMGIFYHLLTLLKEEQYDLLVLDMPATGHTVALTGLPEILLSLVPSGPMAGAMREGQAILNDPDKTAACVVTLPETLPVTEALELMDGLRETSLAIGGVIANRIPNDPFTAEEREVLPDLLTAEEGVFGASAVEAIRRADDAIERLQREVAVPLFRIPDLSAEEELVEAMAERLLPQLQENAEPKD